MNPVNIPYRAYWSTPFAKWQGSLAHLHSIRFAAHVARHALAKRGIDPAVFDYGVLGLTVPQPACFYGLPWLMTQLGAPQVGGPTISQACATGARSLAACCAEIDAGGASVTLAISGDRVSNGPQLYYPNPGGPGGAGTHESWVLDNFARDPATMQAMVQTAENVAARFGISREEQDEVTLQRHAQYGDALADDRAFQRRYMDPAVRRAGRAVSGHAMRVGRRRGHPCDHGGGPGAAQARHPRRNRDLWRPDAPRRWQCRHRAHVARPAGGVVG